MHRTTFFTALALATPMALAGAPQYTIEDLGLVNAGDFASQGMGVSPGGTAFGRSAGSENFGFFANPGASIMGLPNISGKPFGVANGANDSGTVVGVGAETFFGSGAVPVQWTGGVASQLPIHAAGGGVGRANDVNASGVVVGSNGGGSVEFAAYWSGGSVNAITATTQGGSSMTTAFRVNDAGLAVGIGTDPNNAARNVPLMYDTNAGTLTEITTLPGDNGGIAFDISQNGFVVGSSSLNQSGGRAFIWDSANGATELPLPAGASQMGARGVNSNGWVVGTASSAFALPYLYDGDQSYLIQNLIPAGSGWDLSMNTSSSAMGIAEDGTIVGTGVFNGEIRAYRLTLVPAPGAAALLGLGGLMGLRRRR